MLTNPTFWLAAGCFLLGWCVFVLTARRKKRALLRLKTAAQQGDSAAQIELGQRYYRGKGGVAQNDYEAFICFKSAAKSGAAEAQVALAALYHAGRGCARNDKETFRWYQRPPNRAITRGKST